MTERQQSYGGSSHIDEGHPLCQIPCAKEKSHLKVMISRDVFLMDLEVTAHIVLPSKAFVAHTTDISAVTVVNTAGMAVKVPLG